MNDDIPSTFSSDILVVDDVSENLKLLLNLLTPVGYKVRPASNGAEALDAVMKKKPDLILLDIKMPGMDGFEVCKRLKADSQSKEIPIIFISALGETDDKLKAFHAGGVDYITKPFQEKEVLMRVQTHIELHRMRMNLESIVAERTLNLRMSEERFRMTFEQAAVGVAHVSLDGRFMRINQKLCDIVGYSKEEMQARSFQEITHPDDLDADLEYMKQVLDGEIKTYSMEKRYFRRNHEIVWINLTVSLLREDTGEPKYFIAVIEDINNRKQAEEELNEQIQFQELVSRISTKFIGLSGVEFEQAIHDALAAIGRYFNSDTVRLYRLSLQGDVVKIRNQWRDERLSPPKEMTVIHKMKFPNLAAHYSKGQAIVFNKLDDSPRWPEMSKILKFFGTKAGVGVSLEVDSSGVDVFAMDKVQSEHVWPKDIVVHSKTIGQIMLSAVRRREAEVELQDSYDEIKLLKKRLEQENIYLQQEVGLQYKHADIVGESPPVKKMLTLAEQVAGENASVLILGDTGTGKELLAHCIHQLSPRRKRAMVKVNCAALPATLIESELFGREKGAFTGALSRQIGRFEAADGSTIFLDEIGDLPLELQTKLLRVLQEGQFERLGQTDTTTVDVRVIAAANQDLAAAVKAGRFRRDLFYRINVFPITVPPLRSRRDDIPLLIWTFINEFSQSMGKKIEKIPQKTMDMLLHYSWPGNIRELKNIIERAMIVSTKSTLIVEKLEMEESSSQEGTTMEEIERNHIQSVLTSTGWRIRGKGGAAAILDMKPTTLDYRIKKLGIQRRPPT